MDKRKSRSVGRRSSILKIDINKDDDTGILYKGRKSSRRVSFAETYQVKEFPRDSPQVWRQSSSEEEEDATTGKRNTDEAAGNHVTITGLDKLLTGTIQSQAFENVMDYPIPEMSSDSLNMSKLFDVNRTVLGPVDMDTTDVVGNDDIEFPAMEFGQEYSTEIKFDAASFLSNLRGKPSDRLQTMQIFSPTRQQSSMKENLGSSTSVGFKVDRSPLKSLSVTQEPTNRIVPENLPLEHPFHLFDSDVDIGADKNLGQDRKMDAKSFLTNLFGPKQDNTVTSTSLFPSYNNNEERMDDDGSDAENMDETTCCGGIEGKDAVRDLTSQIAAKLERHDNQTMEETRCLGIMNQGINKELTSNEPYNDITCSKIVGMEETTCLGDIMNKTVPKEVSNQWQNKENSDYQIDSQVNKNKLKMLTCDRTDHEITSSQNVAMEETQCVGNIIKEFATQELSNKIQSDDITVHKMLPMDETACIGNYSKSCIIESKYHNDAVSSETESANKVLIASQLGNQTLVMEETKCVGGIVDEISTKELNTENLAHQLATSKSLSIEKKYASMTEGVTANQSTVLVETKCVGGITERSHTKQLFMDKQSSELKADQSEVSTATNPVPDSKEKISSNDLTSKTLSDKSNNTLNHAVEDIKNQGEVLRKDHSKEITLPVSLGEMTANQSIAMDERKCQGDNLNKTNVTKDFTKSVPVNMQMMNQSYGMEETKCLGSILNKSKVQDLPVHVPSSEITATQTVSMEETTCIGGMINKTITKDLIIQENTINQTVIMEETKCLGGMINKTITKDLTVQENTRNQTEMMEETKCLTGMINGNITKDLTSLAAPQENTVDHTVLMEETKCLGSINKNITKNLACLAPPQENTINQTVQMEETKCLGGINKNITKDIASLAAPQENTVNQTILMEETKCLGGINKNITKDLTSLTAPHEITVNQTVRMEETGCLGGMINKNVTKDLNSKTAPKVTTSSQIDIKQETGSLNGLKKDEDKEISHKILQSINKTVSQTFAMEVTDCIDNIIDAVQPHTIESQDYQTSMGHDVKNIDVPAGAKFEDKNQIAAKNIDIQVVNKEGSDGNEIELGVRKVVIENEFSEEQVDDEITFKKTSKERDTDNVDQVTRDMTQSLSRQCQKLKEMLILSKKKTPTHLKRPAESKLQIQAGQSLMSIDSQVTSTDIRSPAHKKKKLFDSGDGLGSVSTLDEKTVPTGELDDFGIEDEQMPDFMKTDGLSMTTLNSVLNDTHRSSADNTTKLKLSSTASTFSSSDTHCSDGQQLDIRADPLSSTALTDDTSSSGSKDMSLYQKQSFLSFNNESCLSFICPDGNITLEMFRKKMAVKPCMVVKSSGRRSSVFTPRIDTEDLTEVILAELTLDPMVKATQAAYEDIKERIKMNEETSAHLQEVLEETQPQIFQDCVNLEGPELLALRGEVVGLHRTCYKLSKLYWTNRTKQAASEALKVIQDEGLSHVNNILEEIRSNTRKMDNFIQSIDEELLEFEKTTKQLEELEQKKNLLEREMENLHLQVKENEQQKNDLSDKIEKHKQEENIQEVIGDIIHQLKIHLFVQEWNLDLLDDHHAVFTFLEGELELRIAFNRTTEKTLVQSIDICSHLNPGCMKISKRLAHSMALAGISKDKLKKYTTLEDLPLLLNEVSVVIGEIRHFCTDLHWLSLSHDIKVDHRRLLCDFWSLETLDEIQVQMDFSPSCPLTTQANINAHVIMGAIRPEKIIDDLMAVKPGRKYLSRLFSAVKFQ